MVVHFFDARSIVHDGPRHRLDLFRWYFAIQADFRLGCLDFDVEGRYLFREHQRGSHSGCCGGVLGRIFDQVERILHRRVGGEQIIPGP